MWDLTAESQSNWANFLTLYILVNNTFVFTFSSVAKRGARKMNSSFKIQFSSYKTNEPRFIWLYCEWGTTVGSLDTVRVTLVNIWIKQTWQKLFFKLRLPLRAALLFYVLTTAALQTEESWAPAPKITIFKHGVLFCWKERILSMKWGV